MADLNVRVVGDARQYERTLKKTETQTRVWARKMEGLSAATGVGGGLFGLGKGGALLAGAGASALALKTVVSAASDAQVILGQTSVAVADAGLSWDKYANQVDAAATRISKASAFDDEAVLQSFQVFVRGQKDVERSIQLSALAADVARGRYTDLDTATQLVNKAAMGQVGALRRAGIAIDKNATATEALTALQAAYGGAAVKYSESAAGATANFQVAVENLEESLGKGLLPAVTSITIAMTDFITKVGEAKDAVNDWFSKHHLGFLNKGLKDLLEPIKGPSGADVFGGGGGGGPAPGMAGPAGEAAKAATDWSKIAGATKKAAAATKAAAMSANELAQRRNDWFDAMVGRREFRLEDAPLRDQLQQLQQIAALISARIAATSDVTRRLALEDELIRVQRQMQGVREQMAADAVAHEQKMADLERQRNAVAQQRLQIKLDWLQFGLEQAQATKGIKDDVKRENAIVRFYKDRIKVEGRKLELVRELWRHEQAIKDLHQQRQKTAVATAAAAATVTKTAAASAAATAPRLTKLEALNRFADLRQFGGNMWARAGAAAPTQVVVNQHFNSPTSDRHREARYAMVATRSVFDS